MIKSVLRSDMQLTIKTGAPMWYDKDPQFSATTLGKDGGAPYTILEGDRVTLDPFPIVSWVQVPVLEVAVRRFAILDRKNECGFNQ